CCKFAIYGILEQDQNIQIFETINPSILFMCPSSKIASYSFIHTNFKRKLYVFTILSFVHNIFFNSTI
ncbi:hypothetical protein, partial [Leptospira noguchii]|uniref:hypothetical protein n=1 Tax=Leptospira noguchii TaxID=28182 RepID=UPI003B967805